MKLAVAGAVVLALVLGFGGGLFLGARAVDRAQADVLAARWVGLVVALAPQRPPYRGELRDPATVATLVGGDLDALSIFVAHAYGELSPGRAHMVRAFAPQARAIAAAQQGAGVGHDRRHLAVLADCLAGKASETASVARCASARGMFGSPAKAGRAAAGASDAGTRR